MSTDHRSTSAPGGAQTLYRALDIVETIAERHGGMTIAELSTAVGQAAPTTHRLCRALVYRGYLRQLADRRYALGTKLVPLGKVASESIGAGSHAVLATLVAELGETANLAVLAGYQAEYVAQAPSTYTMRTFTEIGRRVDLHSTGVGKALLSRLDGQTVTDIVRQTGLPVATPHTISTPTALATELQSVRERGYALDEQEQELGVRCVAMPLRHPSLSWMAISVSGPVTRMTDELVARAVPQLNAAAQRLAGEFASPTFDES